MAKEKNLPALELCVSVCECVYTTYTENVEAKSNE